MLRVAVIIALAAGAAALAQESATPAKPQPAAPQPSGASAATDEGGFASEAERGSYAVGYSLGQMIRLRKLDVQGDPVIAGLRDGLDGSQHRMSEEEATVIARGIQNEALRRVQKEKSELAAKNRAEGTAFLEANKKRAGVVVLPSGLQYEVLRPGDGPKPAIDDTVKVQFHGTLLNGSVWDSSYENRTEPIVIRPNGSIKAWAEALPMMSVGSKWKLFVPPDLGYGDSVAAANIPPGATLIFEVELVSIEPKAKDPQAPGSERD